jgi:hypothetical protein
MFSCLFGNMKLDHAVRTLNLFARDVMPKMKG